MRGEPLILGTSSTMHNGSACLRRGNSVVAAIQEERLTRVKRDCLRPGSRSLAGDDSLAAAGVRPTDLYAVVDCSIATSGEHPLERVLGWPAVQAASSRLELFTIPHHLGHAYSAFCTSGFREALVLVIKAVARLDRSSTPTSEPYACASALRCASTCRSITATTWGSRLLRSTDPTCRTSGTSLRPECRGSSLGHMFSSVSWQLFGDYHAAGKVMALARSPHRRSGSKIS